MLRNLETKLYDVSGQKRWLSGLPRPLSSKPLYAILEFLNVEGRWKNGPSGRRSIHTEH